ncbi:hypothetical protein HDU81_010997 [Chytriomyces hyalinus]|nr:hypothetical protein HDU81_010997 [Chytriomyces hyalinus]
MSTGRTANSTLASDGSPGSSMAAALSTISNSPSPPSPSPASSAPPTTSTSPPASGNEQPPSTTVITTTVSRISLSPPIPTIASESDDLTTVSPLSRPLTTNRSPMPITTTDAVLSPPPPPTQQLVSPSQIMSQTPNSSPTMGSTGKATDPVPMSPSSPQKDLLTTAGQVAPSEAGPSSQELKPDGEFSTSLFSSALPNSPTQKTISSSATPATALLENNIGSDLSSPMPFGAVLGIVLSVFFLLILAVCLIRRWLLPKSEAFQRRKMDAMQSFLPFRVSENPPLDTLNTDATATLPALPHPNSELFNGFGTLHAPLLHRSESFPACVSAATTLNRKNDSQVFDVACAGERLASGKEQVVEGVLADASFLEFISEMAPVSRHFSVASMRPRPTSAISDCPSKSVENTLAATPNIITPTIDPSDPAATLGRNNRGADHAFLVSSK